MANQGVQALSSCRQGRSAIYKVLVVLAGSTNQCFQLPHRLMRFICAGKDKLRMK